MKAALLSSFGPPENLRVTEVPSPELRDGMVRVRVRCVGLNFADVFGRLGVYPAIPKPPFIPGIEFSGDVVAKAAGVKGVRVGARVLGFSRQGAYAEEVCVPAAQLVRMPRRMTYEEGASFLVTYVSAWHGLRTLAQARAGETVLIHAAAGGVGTAALQLGRVWGLWMIGTASTPAKLEIARAQGADQCINYVNEDFEERVRDTLGGNLVDVVMDSVGGRVMKKSWRLLAPMGRYVLYGFAAAAGKKRLHYPRVIREMLSQPIVVPSSFPTRNVSLMGFNLYFLVEKSEYLSQAVQELLELYSARSLAPVIGRVFPFERIVEAHEFLQSRKSVGKVVLSLT